jgi:hypothetical protein
MCMHADELFWIRSGFCLSASFSSDDDMMMDDMSSMSYMYNCQGNGKLPTVVTYI